MSTRENQYSKDGYQIPFWTEVPESITGLEPQMEKQTGKPKRRKLARVGSGRFSMLAACLCVLMVAVVTGVMIGAGPNLGATPNDELDGAWYDQGNFNTEWFQFPGAGNSAAFPFFVSTAEEFAGMAYLMSQGQDFNNRYIRLTGDIDLSARVWRTMGGAFPLQWYWAVGHAFRGHFDGNGHTVTLPRIIEGNTHGDVGPFGRTENATIRNLNIAGEVNILKIMDFVVALLVFSCVR